MTLRSLSSLDLTCNVPFVLIYCIRPVSTSMVNILISVSRNTSRRTNDRLNVFGFNRSEILEAVNSLLLSKLKIISYFELYSLFRQIVFFYLVYFLNFYFFY